MLLEILLLNGNMENISFFFPFFKFWLQQRRIFVSIPGIEPQPQHWMCWVLITGLPGNSQSKKHFTFMGI